MKSFMIINIWNLLVEWWVHMDFQHVVELVYLTYYSDHFSIWNIYAFVWTFMVCMFGTCHVCFEHWQGRSKSEQYFIILFFHLPKTLQFQLFIIEFRQTKCALSNGTIHFLNLLLYIKTTQCSDLPTYLHFSSSLKCA